MTTGTRTSRNNGVRRTELEDLISLSVAAAAARNYTLTVIGMPCAQADSLVEKDTAAALEQSLSLSSMP